MSLGSVIGFFAGEFKRLAISSGLLDANGNPVAGGSSVETWTEVSTSAGLSAALATGGANILVTENFTVSTTLSTVAGRYLVAVKDGKQITFSGFSGYIDPSAGTEFDWHPSCGNKASPALVIASSSTFGLAVANSTNAKHYGYLAIESQKTSGDTGFGGSNAVEMQYLYVSVTGSARPNTGRGSIDFVELETSGSGTGYITAEVSFREMIARGDWRPDDGSSAPASVYSVQIDARSFGYAVECGRLSFVGCTANPLVYLNGSAGHVTLEKVECREASYTPRVACYGAARITGGNVSPVFVAPVYLGIPEYVGCRFLGTPRWHSAGRAVLRDCLYAVAFTFPSGSAPEIRGGSTNGAITLTCNSGSQPLIDGLEVATNGVLVLNSGAAARITNLRGSGTLTNNDPLSIVTGSDDVRRDTTPATRAFADSSGAQSATLNTELLPFIVGYWDCVTLPAPNRGPGLPSCSAGPILDMSTARTVMASSAGLDSGAGTAVWRASMPIYTGAGDFTFSCYHNPDDATPASETHILTAGTTNGLDLLASGALRIYLNGGVILDSSTGVLSDGVESRITYLRRNNAGTPTIYIYVDGVEVGSVANSTVVNPSDYFGNTNGTYANPGVTRRAIVANCGISEATENLLDTHWLQGAGNA